MRTPQVLLGVLRCAGPSQWENVVCESFPDVVVQAQDIGAWGVSPFTHEVARSLLCHPFTLEEASEILGRMRAFHQCFIGSVFESMDPDVVLRVRQAVMERSALAKNLKRLLYEQDYSYESAKALLSASQRLVVETEHGSLDPISQYLPWLTEQAAHSLTGLPMETLGLLRFLFLGENS